jgi:hypothetical protein
VSRFVNVDDRVAVDIGDGDTVWMRRHLDVAGGAAILGVIWSQDDKPLVERLTRAYLIHGIVAWTLKDDDGSPVPPTADNINRLKWDGALMKLADTAADLYGEAVVGPLARMASESSPSGPSDDSTSASQES